MTISFRTDFTLSTLKEAHERQWDPKENKGLDVLTMNRKGAHAIFDFHLLSRPLDGTSRAQVCFSHAL